MESKRLFDALANHVVNNPNEQFLSAKEGIAGQKKWRHYTFQEVQTFSGIFWIMR